ncbi:MerR-like DNA binding protein [Aliiruegeria haliotis]|uniref:MerR-like DNA binding protein n=1 Tax=Aliiruegeria haliotis TaxID=1280846 RepID=A0A2T0RZR8_9RHOB|nr:MerR family transcriptional regulator [Aliiruegeria haliotis]PRY26622.1 MerR-like DNA binding protein [Aliiruegeria haliotis]
MTGKAPDAFRTISEVADWLGVNAHVLRFWESKFSQVKPVKRAGGRRYYRRADMELLGGIQKLLHEDGMTIKGVQKVLREQGVKAVAERSRPVGAGPPEKPVSEPATVDAAEVSEETADPLGVAMSMSLQGDGHDRPSPPEATTAAEIPEQPTEPVSPEQDMKAFAEVLTSTQPPENDAALTAEDEDTEETEDPTPGAYVEAATDAVESAPESTIAPEQNDPTEAELSEGPAGQDRTEPGKDLSAVAEDAPEEGIETAPEDAQPAPLPDSVDGDAEPADIEFAEVPQKAEVMPLFTHRPPDEAEDADDSEDAPGPVIAPLPGSELTVAEALERLQPLQVRPELLRPIHARLVALRERMDSRG